MLEKEAYRVVEKLVEMRYKELTRTLKKNPLFYGMRLVSVALRLAAKERSLLLLGLSEYFF